MKGFEVKGGGELLGFEPGYRKAVALAQYWAKRKGTEVLVLSPNGTTVYHAGGKE